MSDSSSADAAKPSATEIKGSFHLPKIDLAQSASELWQWLVENSNTILMALAICFAIYFALVAIRSFARHKAKKVKLSYWGRVVSTALGSSWSIFLFLVAAMILAEITSMPNPFFGFLWHMTVLVGSFQVAEWTRNVLIVMLEHRAQVDRKQGSRALTTALGVLRNVISVVVYSIATIFALNNLGFNVTALMAGLGIGGVAVGLGARGIFEDLFAALAILFDQPFRKGDTIMYDDTIARVSRIGVKSTRLHASSGEHISISNKNLLDKQIANITHASRLRINIKVYVSGDATEEMVAQVPELMRQSAAEYKNKDIQIFLLRAGFFEMKLDGIIYRMDIDIIDGTRAKMFEVRAEIGQILAGKLRKANIKLSHP